MREKIVDNTHRPAQPEPDEDPAVERVPRREQGTRDNPRFDEKPKPKEQTEPS